ncbi:Cof-type HAD-IIB family hydrolase [Mycoplasmopsis ciconiae]|uniref:Cof-type HAD-IIB family hydrolase n=1 Tax=Mycoplasmopsis ciconiae TaxID=561067 RepID=A0ABU7MM77_9BACT|nr:Cof-type HAD-IIB family hydrolase [Mycoplasmopsis ciconiae]
MNKIFGVKNKHFEDIKNKIKTTEIRYYDHKYKHFSVNDLFRVVNEETAEEIICKITNINVYPDLKNLSQKVNVYKCGFNSSEDLFDTLKKYYPNDYLKEFATFDFEILGDDLSYLQNFVFDMDGTLLNKNGQLSESNIKALNYLKAKNKNIFIATGRPYYTAQKYIHLIPYHSYMISSNGSLVYNLKTNILEQYTSMPKDIALLIYKKLVELEYDFLVYTNWGILGYNANKTSFFKEKNYKSFLDENTYKEGDLSQKLSDWQVCKFLVLSDSNDPQTFEQIASIIKQNSSIYYVYSQANMIDIMPKQASKANGLKYVIEKLNLDKNKTICFGDADNDISNFEFIKHSVAMANASDKVKSQAVFVAQDNDKDWLESFIKKHHI